MINHILLICFSLFTYEIIRLTKLKDIIKKNFYIYKKIFKLFKFKSVSDFRKEKLILNYSKSLFIISLKILLVVILILTFIYLLNLFFLTFLNLISSFFGIAELSIVVTLYHVVRKN